MSRGGPGCAGRPKRLRDSAGLVFVPLDPKTGKVMSDNGSYVTVYKKQQDGSWKAVEDFAVAEPGSAKPVEPGKPVTRAKIDGVDVICLGC